MDKVNVIEYLWKRYTNTMNGDDVKELITSYCKEHGKEDDALIELFLILVSASGIVFSLVDEVLRKYKIQHEIVEVYKPDTNGMSVVLIY